MACVAYGNHDLPWGTTFVPLTLVTLRKNDWVKFVSVKGVNEKVRLVLACMYAITISFQLATTCILQVHYQLIDIR